MGEVRWIPTHGHIYRIIYAEHYDDLHVFGTHTCMEGCEFHSKPYMLTEWGFEGADYPLIRSEYDGRKGERDDRAAWLYYIAQPIEDSPDER